MLLLILGIFPHLKILKLIFVFSTSQTAVAFGIKGLLDIYFFFVDLKFLNFLKNLLTLPLSITF